MTLGRVALEDAHHQPISDLAGRPKDPTNAQQQQARHRSGLLLGIVLTATFVQLLDSTIVNVAVPAIRTELGASSGQIQLVLAGYQLAFACLLVAGGRLGDRFGRRRLFLIGMTCFVIASAACAAAASGPQLVVTRMLQGAASGLMFPQVLSIIQVTVPGPRRAKALGLYGATVGLSTVLGPVLGGLLLDPLACSWRAVFWVNVPIGVAAVALALRYVPESRAPLAVRLDPRDVLLLAGGLFVLMTPLVLGREAGWPWWTFASMGVGLLVLAWFAIRQRSQGHEALVAPSLFADRHLRLGVVMNLVFFAGVGPFFFILVLSLQAGLGHDALVAGLATVPFALAAMIASGRSAGIAARLGTRVLVLGCALLVLGHAGVIATIYLHGPDTEPYYLAAPLAVAGFGMGLFVAPVTHVILATVAPQQAGSASGVLATAQQVAGAFGVAVLGVIFFGLLGHNAPAAVTGDTSIRQTLASMPAETAASIEHAAMTCYHDRVTATDPTAPPVSCTRIPQALAAVPAARRGRVVASITAALPQANRVNFTTSLREALVWEVAVFTAAGALAVRLARTTRPRRATRNGDPR